MNAISNFQLQTSKFLETWRTIVTRPIYFLATLKEEDWREGALTYCLQSAWLLAFVASLAFFLLQFVPVGRTLVEGVTGLKFLIILPVLLTLTFVFFMITFLIVGGLFVGFFFSLAFIAAQILHQVFTRLGGRGSLARLLQAAFFSTAAAAPLLLVFLLMPVTKYAGLNFSWFVVGFNLSYLLMLIWFGGLWAVAGRKLYGLSKGRAWLGALAVILGLLIFGLIFDKIGLPKLRTWTT